MEPQVTKFLAGGLHLLAAGDSTPEGMCIAAQNWRTDQAANLRSRKSNSAAVFAGGGTVVHSICTVNRSSGPQRYYAQDQDVYRGNTLLGSAGLFDGKALQLVSFQDRLWIMNQAAQKKDDGGNFFAWTPTKPAAAPTFVAGGAASGGLNGNYNYYVTFVTDAGEETNPSPAEAVTGLGANDSVTITRPANADAQNTMWNVYREGGSFPLQSYKVNSEPIVLSTTTYVDLGVTAGTGGDDQSDLGIATLGVTMPFDHDPAPAAKGLAGPYFGKLLAYNSAAHPNRIWWTESDAPAFFPGSQSDQDGNWVDIGEEGEEGINVAVFPRVAIVQKGKNYFRLVGDPEDWGSQIERIAADVGQIGTKAWAIAGSSVYGQATEGIYLATTSGAEKISPGLDPIFKQDTILATGAIPSTNINSGPLVRAGACMAYRNGRLYFSYASSASAGPLNLNDTTLVYDSGKWFSDSRGFTALYDEGQGGSLLGAIGPNVYELESGSAEANIPLIYQTRYEDQGAPENKKRYADIVIDHNTGGRTFTVYAYLDNGTVGPLNLGTFTSTTRSQTTFTLGDDDNPAEYRNISIRLECDTGNAEADIYALVLHYLPLERNARTYDTNKVALEKASLLGALELDLEILSGKVLFKFWAGLYNGLAVIAEGEFSGADSGKIERTFTAQLPDGTEARWIRLNLAGDNYRCHGARLQVRPYGMFLAGVDDIYRSGDLTFGSPRPKLVQQIRIGCQPDDTVPGQFYTDMPDGLAARQDISLAKTTARSWQRTTFPVNTQGRVMRLELTAPAPCRIYEIQVRVKVLGEPGGWQWRDVPVPATPEEFAWIPLPIT